MKPELNPEIVTLGPMRVASCRATGTRPEIQAFRQIVNWAEKAGLADAKGARYFGFDNPSPSKGAPEYGYEVWMTAGADAKESDRVTMKQFPGGMYAVLRTRLPKIAQSWKQLLAWRADSEYEMGTHQCLEEHLSLPLDNSLDEVEVDLYLPIAE